MKFFIFIALSFLLLSCANLAKDRWDDEGEEKVIVTASTASTAELVGSPELPKKGSDDDLQLVDPDTTAELMNDENKKTVSGPARINTSASESGSTIDIKPSTPAPTEE